MNQTSLAKPKVEGVGGITYRCAVCKEPVAEPVFHPPLPLKPKTRTYHQEHLPNGR